MGTPERGEEGWAQGRQRRSRLAWKVGPARFPWLGGGPGGKREVPDKPRGFGPSSRRKGVADGWRGKRGEARGSLLNNREQAVDTCE